MAKFIALLNRISETWFNLIALNSLHLVILFALLFGIALVFRKKSSIFLYTLWSLLLLKAVLLPVVRLPFLHHTVLPAIPLNPAMLNVTSLRALSEKTTGVSLSIPSILLLLWITAILGLLLVYVRNEHRFYRSLRGAESLPVQGRLRKLIEQLGIRKPVTILLSPRVPAPFTRGLRKPVIYLPQSALDWNQHQLDHVFCHELAHIQRKDILMIAFQNLINVLYFFHPLVWLANHQLNFQREKICDDTAIQILNENPTQYGRTLMNNLESFLVQRRLPLIANGLFFSKRTIIRRFEYLLTRGKEIPMNLGLIQKIALVSLAILIIITACSNPPKDTPAVISATTEKSSPPTNVTFVPYDVPPQPVGGFKTLQKNILYPQKDLDAGHEGTVIVQAYVDENGDVTKASILKSPGLASLDSAALNAVKQTKFTPAMQRDKSIGVWISIPIEFRLGEEQEIDDTGQSQTGSAMGKLYGTVVDNATGNPLQGANVWIPDTRIGAASDANGQFFLPCQPGKYTFNISVLGYQPVVLEGVMITALKTTSLEIKLDRTTIQTEEVILHNNAE
jgi:TonB family protein